VARCTNDQVEQALSQYLTAVSRRWRIERAILFGSRARDDYTPEEFEHKRRDPGTIQQATIEGRELPLP
jgi:hypothetical protein